MDWTGGFLQDLRYAARLARRQPRHTLLTIGMTALGIGATTALFSVAYGVLWKPLPWPRAPPSPSDRRVQPCRLSRMARTARDD